MFFIIILFMKYVYLQGGSKGGIRINKSDYSPREIEALCRSFTIELAKKNFIGAQIGFYFYFKLTLYKINQKKKDVPGPDYGTGE